MQIGEDIGVSVPPYPNSNYRMMEPMKIFQFTCFEGLQCMSILKEDAGKC